MGVARLTWLLLLGQRSVIASAKSSRWRELVYIVFSNCYHGYCMAIGAESTRVGGMYPPSRGGGLAVCMGGRIGLD